MINILGIESSCDETAVAIINDRKEILGHVIASQQKEHEIYGGVVPELAARAHLNNIEPVIAQLFNEANISLSQIDAIAATFAPGLIGGLIVGNMFAKTLCSALQCPFIAVNHLEAHLLMPTMFNNVEFPFLAILISGGHSQIIYAADYGIYKILGKTIDDSIGETFDKVALMLGFNYPGGPLIEQCALKGDINAFKLPCPLIQERNANFSFSGLKTHIKLLIAKQSEITEEFKANLCASFQFTVAKILINRIENALISLGLHNLNNIIISGGVAANKYIRTQLEYHFLGYHIIYPPSDLCTDNGIMIAWNGLLKYQRGLFETFDSGVAARSNLENNL